MTWQISGCVAHSPDDTTPHLAITTSRLLFNQQVPLLNPDQEKALQSGLASHGSVHLSIAEPGAEPISLPTKSKLFSTNGWEVDAEATATNEASTKENMVYVYLYGPVSILRIVKLKLTQVDI